MKISSIDPNTKTELTKLFFVNEDTSVRKLMTSALPKFSLSGNLESYSLYYKSEHGGKLKKKRAMDLLPTFKV